MTAQELRDNFLIEFDRITNSEAPGYEDNEISYFLNKAQRNFFLLGYNPKSNSLNEGFEETELRSKSFSELKRFSTISVGASGNHPNSNFYLLPDGLWLTLKEQVDLTYNDDCGDEQTERINVKPITEDYYNANIENPLKNPYKDLIWRLDFSRNNVSLPISSTNLQRHELIGFNGGTLGNYYISYVAYPQDIDITNNITSEFSPNFHHRIVELAVEIALETIEDKRFQTKQLENNSILQ